MNSFYGGKQGRTYHLVERYDQIYIDESKLNPFVSGDTYEIGTMFTSNSETYKVLGQYDEQGKIITEVVLTLEDLKDQTKVAKIKGMVNEFQKGGAYTDANYGQYVIIDTILNENHRNDQINGLIYRRGFDYTEPVVSYKRPTRDDMSQRTFPNPDGGEDLKFRVNTYHDYDLVKRNNEWVPNDLGFNDDKWTAAWRRYVIKPGGGAIYVGHIVGPQGDTPELKGMSWEDFIQYYEQIGDDISKGQIEASKTLGWDGQKYNDTIQLGYCNIEDKDGNLTGCYISFDIPKLVMKISAQSVDPYGDTPRNHYDEASQHTDENIEIIATQDPITKKWKYENLIHEHSRSGHNAVDDQGNPSPHPFYENFDIAIPDGIHGRDIEEIKHETVQEINEQLEEQDRIVIDNENVFAGDQYISYYTRDYQDSAEGAVSVPLGRWPYRVINIINPINKERNYPEWGSQAKVGDLYKPEDTNKYLLCIQGGTTPAASPSGHDTVGEQFIIEDSTAKWRVVQLPTEVLTKLEVDYTAGPNDNINVKTLDYVFMDDTGDWYAVYSQDDIPKFLAHSLQIKEISYNANDFDNAQKFTVEYKNGQTHDVSEPIDRILAIDRVGDNAIVLYSDPAHRAAIAQGRKGIDWFEKPYEGITGSAAWQNLGALGSQFHYYGDLTFEDLKTTYKDGLGTVQETKERAGWIVSVTDNTVDPPMIYLYAYDYADKTQEGTHKFPDNTSTKWHSIMSVSEQVAGNPDNILIIAEDTGGDPQGSDKIKEHGVWFVVSGGHDTPPNQP